MSANHWDICPRCKKRAAAVQERRRQHAAERYGKVPAEEYLRLRREADNPPKMEATLREDWEIGTDSEGSFQVVYSCSCKSCGFEYEFRHKEQLQVEKDGDKREGSS